MNTYQKRSLGRKKGVIARAMTLALTILSLHLTGCGTEVHRENLSQTKDAAFVGRDIAWIVTIDGDLLRTADGGSQWQSTSGTPVGGFESVATLDGQRGLAVNRRGQVWKTDDGGGTWRMLAELSADRWAFNESGQILLSDALHGWIVETLTVWCTRDGGASWEMCFSRSAQGAHGQPVRAFFLNSQLGWVCGTDGEIYQTKDGGKSWETRVVMTKNSDFTDVFFVDQDAGWLVGYSSNESASRLYQTMDGGKHWQLLPNTVGDSFVRSISVRDHNVAWAVGNQAQPDRPGKRAGVVLSTSDGGRIWHTSFHNDNEPFYSRIYLSEDQTGWLIGRDSVYRTVDLGKHWNRVLEVPKQIQTARH
jgi:photosystem II stability/assembly factor-like uncharacterized protein